VQAERVIEPAAPRGKNGVVRCFFVLWAEGEIGGGVWELERGRLDGRRCDELHVGEYAQEGVLRTSLLRLSCSLPEDDDGRV